MLEYKKFIRKVQQFFRATPSSLPLIIARENHNISRNHISAHALKVLYRLKQHGYESYLVGGGVRDLLLERKPKDFDVVTNAKPEEIRKIFKNCRLIGRRFRLAHVYFESEIIEVSTFRANVSETTNQFPKQLESDEIDNFPNLVINDNIYGTIQEDAWRRDFTINALFYHIADFSVVDYTGGMEDLQNKTLRMIGDPIQRFHEDPIRLLRAIRLSAKLGFEIHRDTYDAILKLRKLIFNVPKARLMDEVLKLFFEGSAYVIYQRLVTTGYMDMLFPATMEIINQAEFSREKLLVDLAMQASDTRFANDQSLNPGYLFAVLLWVVLQKQIQQHIKKGVRWFKAFSQAVSDVIDLQLIYLLIPRRMIEMIRALWLLQYSLERRRVKRIYSIYRQRYFRAALDFLELRMQAGEQSLRELVSWWRQFQEGDAELREQMLDALKS